MIHGSKIRVGLLTVPFLATLLLMGCESSDRGLDPVDSTDGIEAGGAAKLTVSGNAVAGQAERVFSYTFDGGPQGWIGDFADLPVTFEDEGYFLEYDPAKALPAELGDGRSVPFFSGVNRSDDLFMYLRRHIEGLRPNTTYQVDFRVQFATNVPDNLFGVGGSPGSSVFVRVGVSQEEPVRVAVGDQLRLAVEKGNQSSDGPSDVVIGNVVKPINQEPNVYEFKTLDNRAKPLSITTNRSGSVWVFIGTDSGFESLSEFYYSRIRLVFSDEG